MLEGRVDCYAYKRAIFIFENPSACLWLIHHGPMVISGAGQDSKAVGKC